MPTASTAATASSTLPGPTGSPAARKVRAKCIRLATSRPSLACAGAGNPHPLAAPTPSLPRKRGRGFIGVRRSKTLPRGRGREGPALKAREGGGPMLKSRLSGRGGDLGLDLLQKARRLAALNPGDVVLVFQQDAERVVD